MEKKNLLSSRILSLSLASLLFPSLDPVSSLLPSFSFPFMILERDTGTRAGGKPLRWWRASWHSPRINTFSIRRGHSVENMNPCSRSASLFVLVNNPFDIFRAYEKVIQDDASKHFRALAVSLRADKISRTEFPCAVYLKRLASVRSRRFPGFLAQ